MSGSSYVSRGDNNPSTQKLSENTEFKHNLNM